MELEMVEELIPIVLFTVVAIIVWLVVYFRFRSKSEMQQTIRLALEKGAELSPELVAALSDPEPNKDRDLRRGIIWLALAAGLVLSAFAVPDPTGDALRGILTGAAFPFAIGVGYMIMWRYTSGQEAQG
jgi:uncharacterized protein DUF6249